MKKIMDVIYDDLEDLDEELRNFAAIMGLAAEGCHKFGAGDDVRRTFAHAMEYIDDLRAKLDDIHTGLLEIERNKDKTDGTGK